MVKYSKVFRFLIFVQSNFTISFVSYIMHCLQHLRNTIQEKLGQVILISTDCELITLYNLIGYELRRHFVNIEDYLIEIFLWEECHLSFSVYVYLFYLHVSYMYTYIYFHFVFLVGRLPIDLQKLVVTSYFTLYIFNQNILLHSMQYYS